MPKRSSNPRDLNQLAAYIVEQATSDAVPESLQPEQLQEPEKNPAAVALGRLGGLKGGKARAEKLSPEERSAIAKKAAEARWKKLRTVKTNVHDFLRET
jgi:hypothetical protein